jgi:hypothetical protein
MKRCSKCHRELPLTEFYRRKDRPCGYDATCKACCSLEHAAWQAKRRKHYNAYMRQYGKQYRQEHGDPTHPERAKRWALNKTLKKEGIECS